MKPIKVTPRLVLMLLCLAGISTAARRESRITKRSTIPIVHDINTLDYYIELIEKADSKGSIKTIANSIRNTAGYNYTLLELLLGKSKPLPEGVLTNDEKQALIRMTFHKYEGSRELGVALTRGGDTVAMGPVILGICAGMSRNTQLSLASWDSDAEDPVDNLFAATISGDLARTGLQQKNDPGNRVLYGPGGSWNSLECPSAFTKSGSKVSSASDALLLGDVDGFLLGYGAGEWAKKGVRLGQLLRMYYDTGVCYDESFRACNRYKKLKSILSASTISMEVGKFAFAWFSKYGSQFPGVTHNEIPDIAKKTSDEFFPYLDKIHTNKYCSSKDDDDGCELPANLVFVMDESGSITLSNYQKEKAFVSKVIDAFDISPYQTRVAVVTYSNAPRLKIELSDYGSKTRLKCAVGNFGYAKGNTRTAAAINKVNDEILRPEGTGAATDMSVVPVMILLTDGKSNNEHPTALEDAVSRIRNDIQGITMVAVGISNQIDRSELRLIASDPDDKHVFYANDFNALIKMVKSIQKRTCESPTEMELDFRQDGNDTVITAYVSPNKPRFFILPSHLFFRIPDIVIHITPVYGTVAVYASRFNSTPGPESYVYKIDPISDGKVMQLTVSDPCEGYSNQTSCPPIYLAVYGGTAELTCVDRYCTVPSQIKFTIKGGLPSGTRQNLSLHGCILLLLVYLASIVTN